MKFSGKNIEISPLATIGENVRIGDNTIIYDHVEIKEGTTICNNCVIGEPLNDYYNNPNYKQPVTIIGAHSLIRSHTIIYAGSTFGTGLQTGHRVTVRELTTAGDYCSFGTNSDIQGHCKIGNYNRFHSYVNIGQQTITGDYVFIYPFVVLTNDPTPPSEVLMGVEIGDYTQVAASAVILPAAKIGKHCLVGANAVVSGVYEDDSFINGNPAQLTGRLSKMPFFNTTGKKHYPWPKHFSRRLPWANEGYENWLKNTNQ